MGLAGAGDTGADDGSPHGLIKKQPEAPHGRSGSRQGLLTRNIMERLSEGLGTVARPRQVPAIVV